MTWIIVTLLVLTLAVAIAGVVYFHTPDANKRKR